jgi:hypothetical protein
LATALLGTSDCKDGQTFAIEMDPATFTSKEGVKGSGAVLTANYTFTTAGPTVAIAWGNSGSTGSSSVPSTINATARPTFTATVSPSPAGGTSLTELLTATGGGVVQTVTTGSGNPQCAVSVTTTSPTSAEFVLGPCTGDGTTNVSLAAGIAKDAAKNGSTASNQLSVTVDNTAPKLTTAPIAGTTVALPLTTKTLVFSEAVSAQASDFLLLVNDTSYPLTVSGSGTPTIVLNFSLEWKTPSPAIRIGIKPDAPLADLAGNKFVAPSASENPPLYAVFTHTGGDLPCYAAPIQDLSSEPRDQMWTRRVDWSGLALPVVSGTTVHSTSCPLPGCARKPSYSIDISGAEGVTATCSKGQWIMSGGCYTFCY